MRDPLSQELPVPSDVALDHSRSLERLIKQRCDERTQTLSFAEYMAMALYEPAMGYYMAGAAKFGQNGDFITAPELTPLFGATLANQVREITARTGGGILELGAGSGALAAGLLEALHDQAVDYAILEPSAELRLRQKNLLASRVSEKQFLKITWLDQLPEAFTGVIIANEVMDALPVERFKVENGLQQMHVSNQIKAVYAAPSNALIKAVSAIESDLGRSLPEKYSSEVCLLLEPWVASLADVLVSGVVLLADYGYSRQEYYSPERHNGTLACYYRHRMHDDPFLWPGLQDITSHVDFTAVVESGVNSGLELLGYASQSAFLLDNGLLTLMEEQQKNMGKETDRIALSKVVKTLTLPGEMGERFQVMALGKHYDHPLQGFRSQDLSYRL